MELLVRAGDSEPHHGARGAARARLSVRRPGRAPPSVQIDSVSAALDLFYLDAGRYPSQSEGLTVLIKRPPSVDNWNGPYSKQSALPPGSMGPPVPVSRSRPERP